MIYQLFYVKVHGHSPEPSYNLSNIIVFILSLLSCCKIYNIKNSCSRAVIVISSQQWCQNAVFDNASLKFTERVHNDSKSAEAKQISILIQDSGECFVFCHFWWNFTMLLWDVTVAERPCEATFLTCLKQLSTYKKTYGTFNNSIDITDVTMNIYGFDSKRGPAFYLDPNKQCIFISFSSHFQIV